MPAFGRCPCGQDATSSVAEEHNVTSVLTVLIWIVVLGPPMGAVALLIGELTALFFNRRLLLNRSHLRFGLPMMFAVTTAVAILCSLCVGTDVVEFGLLDVLLLLVPLAFLVFIIYLVGILLADCLEAFGWIKPRFRLSNYLARQRASALIPSRGCGHGGVPNAGKRESALDTVSGTTKKIRKKRRKWWSARRWPNRWRPVIAGQDHRMPVGRDEF